MSQPQPEPRLAVLGGALEPGQAIPGAQRHDRSLRRTSGWRGQGSGQGEMAQGTGGDRVLVQTDGETQRHSDMQTH